MLFNATTAAVPSSAAASRLRRAAKPTASSSSCFRPAATNARSTRRIASLLCRATEADEPRMNPTQSGELKEEAQPDNPYQPPHTGRNSPMSEDKRAATAEQMAAPEGDRAIAGQAWQPTSDSKETPEERFGGAEAAEEFAEASKDRSRKSELQTSDEQAQAPGGGMTGEGSSA